MRHTEYGIVFDYWGDFVTHAESAHSDMPKASRRSRTPHHDSFTNVGSFEEAIRMAREGWAWGEAKARNLSDNMFAKISKHIERWDCTYDIQGAALDIGRFMVGDPCCFQNFEPTYIEGPGHELVHIVFNASVSACIDRDVIIARGALCAALTQLLEYAGHSVKVDISSGTRAYGRKGKAARFPNEKNDFELWVNVKEYGQPLDLSIVIFALAHPATLRCLEFSVMETMPQDFREMMGISKSGGYGVPAEIDDPRRGDIYIPSGHAWDNQWQDADVARDWIVNELKNQGVDIKNDDLYLYV